MRAALSGKIVLVTGEAFSLRADFSLSPAVAGTIDLAADRSCGLDILVNNASGFNMIAEARFESGHTEGPK